ncbi:MAG: BREX-1 system phosphatase PglZ type A [Bacteroidetes bacterium]|nr:BREX-1 system phosphatase PglZ type A [Bacteroidota bacterium]
MKAEQVDQALCQKFLTEEQRLVFWNDPNGEFIDYINTGLPSELELVTILDVSKQGGLSAKLTLEQEDNVGKFLIYSTGTMPKPEEDWLLDIRLYSSEFHADVASIWLQELGLNELYLRDHLQSRATFLGSQERRKKLKKFISTNDDQTSIDLKMMAVLAGSEVASLSPILRALCHGHLKNGRYNLNESPAALQQFDKMDLSEHFWQLGQQNFGYTNTSPTLSGLLRHIFVSELFHQLDGTRIDSLSQFVLPDFGRQNAAVCLTQWRDSAGKAKSYDGVAKAIASELQLRDKFGELSLELLVGVSTFWEVEGRVLSLLKNRAIDEAQAIDVDAISVAVTARKTGYWLAGPGRDDLERCAMADSYDAIVAAAELFALRNKTRNTLTFENASALLASYRDELYRFDQFYRQFFVKIKAAQGQGWDLLKTLAEEVERVYDQAFLQPLGLEWGRLLDGGFLESWQLPEMPSQQDFYADKIRSHLQGSDKTRAYVIISDALRYEAACEFTEVMNGEYRMEAKLSSMLGVLPSYTSLGMASLLPHQSLSYTDKGEVLVDGKPVGGTDARSKQLSTVDGMACQSKELSVLKQDAAREYIHGKRVVYIYHNVIDARGDSAPTEGETFTAVEDCIKELVELVLLCNNKLNASTVWVTSDHGFLYQQEAPGITDKSTLEHKPDHAIKMKKRYVIGKGLGVVKEAHQGYTHVTAGTDCDTEFWVPRGANRFHFTGGARFVHGGAMPQEVVIPVVKVTQLRGKKKESSRIEKVSIQVLGIQHKITAPKYRFELIQTDKVSERCKPLTVRAAVYDGARAVTSVVTVTFDSKSDSLEERKKTILIELSSGDFDKTKPYRLVLRDVDTDAEVQSIQVTIDRSFDDDF